VISYGLCETDKAVPDYSLSLEEAVALAFKNNKDIHIQEQEVNAAKAVVVGARSKFLPNLNASAGYTHFGSFLTIPSIWAKEFGVKKDPGIFFGFQDNNRVGVELDQNIYNGGANIANLRQAQVNLKIQKETLRARKLDVEFETKSLYYGVLLAYETERITEDLVNQAQSHYEDVKKKFGQGTSSKFDVLQSKVQVSKLIPELVKAKNAIDLIAADLKKMLGLKMQDSLMVKDKLLYSLIEIREEEFLKQAYLNKPEMNLKALGIDITEWAIQMAKSGWRPRVNAELSNSYSSNNLGNIFNDRHSNWNAGFTVTIPIFDGFSTKAKVDETKARYAQATLEKENLIDQIAVDIKQACLDLKQAETIINSSKDNIEEAKEALRIAEVRYDNGEGTNLDVLDAQVSLSQIEKNLSEGIYDYVMAKAFLDRTMGQGYLEEAKNEKKD
jgi:outer membrane protein TolC